MKIASYPPVAIARKPPYQLFSFHRLACYPPLPLFLLSGKLQGARWLATAKESQIAEKGTGTAVTKFLSTTV